MINFNLRQAYLQAGDFRSHHHALKPVFFPLTSQSSKTEKCRHTDYVVLRWVSLIRPYMRTAIHLQKSKNTIHFDGTLFSLVPSEAQTFNSE